MALLEGDLRHGILRQCALGDDATRCLTLLNDLPKEIAERCLRAFGAAELRPLASAMKGVSGALSARMIMTLDPAVTGLLLDLTPVPTLKRIVAAVETQVRERQRERERESREREAEAAEEDGSPCDPLATTPPSAGP